jgi:hypothetical protein
MICHSGRQLLRVEGKLSHRQEQESRQTYHTHDNLNTTMTAGRRKGSPKRQTSNQKTVLYALSMVAFIIAFCVCVSNLDSSGELDWERPSINASSFCSVLLPGGPRLLWWQRRWQPGVGYLMRSTHHGSNAFVP